MEINQLIAQEPIKPTTPSKMNKLTFFAFGVSSISGWNAVLTALDYFAVHYQDYNVYFNFPVPMFLSLCLTSFFLPKISLWLTLTFRIAWTLIATCIVLVMMPLITEFVPALNGFMINIGLIFMLGIFSGLQQNSSLAIASILGKEYVAIFFAGTGFSGAIICIFRIICLATLKDNDALSCLVYFCVAALWNIFSVALFFRFRQTIQYSLCYTPLTTQIDSAGSDADADTKGTRIQEIQQKTALQIILHINRITFPVPLCIILIYIQTFMMFPGVALEINFPATWSAWGPTLLILTFSLGDTLGKCLAGYHNLYNESSQLIIIFLRFGFFVTFYMILKGRINHYGFTIGNLFLFAVTNGFATSGMMQIGPEKVPSHERERVGYVQGFSLVFGIMLGSFLAVPLQYLEATN